MARDIPGHDVPSPAPESAPILEIGRSCWRREAAERVAFLIDGNDYFAALASAIERARRQILVVGWDVHSRVALRREPDGQGRDEFAQLLDRCVRREPDLHVYVLGWDFAMIYAPERELLPLLRFGMRTHARVHFQLDGRHPVGGSHHQKLVVVDDAIAFCGGLDVTAGRWDTPEHRAHDPRRRMPDGTAYLPFHDVQIAVDGAAAGAVGDLARERWRHATGESLGRPEGTGDPWPAELVPDLRTVPVAVARARPAYRDLPEVREIERLHLDAVRAAHRTIYVESQYLSAARIAEAMEERLREPDGPEIVIVTRKSWSGWLEETTMAMLRARIVERLENADRHNRLRLYYPVVPDLAKDGLQLHSKLMIVDDRFVRVGSANLSNRSMGLDSECDLAIEAEHEDHVRAIVAFRSRLLAEHLDTSPERVAEEQERRGSLVAAIESLNGGPRRLQPLDAQAPEWIDEFAAEIGVLDPERPIELERLRRQLLPEEEIAKPARARMAIAGTVAVSLVVLAAAWHLTPLGDWANAQRMVGWIAALRADPTGPWLGLGLFVAAATLLVPVTALVAAAALLYGWALGSSIALAGSIVAALLGYGIGAGLPRDTVRRWAGASLDRVNRRLARRGLISTISVRVVPVAAFSVVNLVAGASHVRLRDFVLGTAIGMTPGVLVLALFSEGAWATFQEPRADRIAVLVATALVLLGAAFVLRRRAHDTNAMPRAPGTRRRR